jgi:integrase
VFEQEFFNSNSRYHSERHFQITVAIVKSDPLYHLLAACASGKEQTDYLFTRDNPKKTILDFRQSWKLACTAAGKPDMHFHDLRQTAVSNMEATGEIRRSVAMSITGHKTEGVTSDDMNKHRKGAQAAAVKAIFARRNCSLNAVNTTQSERHQRASESTDRIEKTV